MYDNNETFKIHTYLVKFYQETRRIVNCAKQTFTVSLRSGWPGYLVGPCWGLINVESRGDTPYYGLYKEAFPKS